MYVCICHGITDRAIREARERGIVSVEHLGAETGCGATCGSCRPVAAQLLNGDESGALATRILQAGVALHATA